MEGQIHKTTARRSQKQNTPTGSNQGCVKTAYVSHQSRCMQD